MSNILEEIVYHKRIEFEESKKKVGYSELEKMALASPARPSFLDPLKNESFAKIKLIAEVKKASPSKGVIDPNFDPMKTAALYAKGGVHCMSILTESKYFQGAPEYLQQIVQAHPTIPCLRKDFIVDEYQILEAKLWGASAILLIVDCLVPKDLTRLREFAESLDLSVLVETHRKEEVEVALECDSTIIGVNNRNLRSFETTLETTYSLREMIPHDKIVISESGIHSPDQVKKLLEHNVHGILVGESLMRQKGDLLESLIQ